MRECSFRMISFVLVGCFLVPIPANSARIAVVYSFSGGSHPQGGLINLGGTLYGTTSSGGAGGYGSVFSVTRTGSGMVLHSFGNGTDGAYPIADLLNLDNDLYGVTYAGGTHNLGTVYSMTKAGAEKILHSFRGGADGANPYANLKSVGGMIYGTTSVGGSSGYGTVFSLTKTGGEKVVYAFKGGSDGAYPEAGLIALNGILYGTTEAGGSADCNNGCGTVFALTPSGEKTLVHTFDEADGAAPAANLTRVGTTFYGTTYNGGKHGNGTVFSVTTAGVEETLYSFRGGARDGANPKGDLTNVGGTFYGTTSFGGASCGHGQGGCGVVFSISPSGSEEVLCSLHGRREGYETWGGLAKANGDLYGTTYYGGYDDGGSVFVVRR